MKLDSTMTKRRNFLGDRRGISSVEFALVCTVFFVFVFGIVDFTRAMWEWNAAAKATQVGVRYAVVNDMVSTSLANLKLVGVGGLQAGDAVPIGTAGTTNVITCTKSGGTGTCTGAADPSAFDDTAFTAIVTRMQSIYSDVTEENVVVEYRHVGLGFVGNPLGSDVDPAVTVRLTGLVFDFVTPGLSGIVSINMPDFAATLTGEDGRSS